MTNAAEKNAKQAERGKRDVRICTVTSDKGDKTITVAWDYSVRHPKYGKHLRRRSTLRAHDEKNEARVGDRVEVTACRRLSKTKCWRLTRIVKRGTELVETTA